MIIMTLNHADWEINYQLSLKNTHAFHMFVKECQERTPRNPHHSIDLFANDLVFPGKQYDIRAPASERRSDEKI